SQPRVAAGGAILVIDDDPWFRFVVRALLMGTAYKPIEAENGKQGIELLRRACVDVLMTDLMMPEQGGLATIVSVRTEFPDVRILAVSGVEDRAFLLRAAEIVGANAAIEK